MAALGGVCSMANAQAGVDISKAPVSVARLDNSVWKARHEAKLQEQPEIAAAANILSPRQYAEIEQR